MFLTCYKLIHYVYKDLNIFAVADQCDNLQFHLTTIAGIYNFAFINALVIV